MIDRIYIEQAVVDHPRTHAILERFGHAERIGCERYTHVFNPKSQNFRLQKKRPALILARKHGNRVLEAPAGYGVGGERNYYFSHMLNCLYDCRYCFLQGMYRSAHYVLFVNYEDFMDDVVQAAGEGNSYFFSGYDCDSLALEPVSGFVDYFVERFRHLDGSFLELRTKSTQIRALLERPATDNCIVAFSLSPDAIARRWELRAPTLERRLDAMVKLQQAGWMVGLRLDPVLYVDEYETVYGEFFRQVFSRLDGAALHSVSLGAFRMPDGFFKQMHRLYPAEPLFAAHLQSSGGQVTYGGDTARRLLDFCREQVLRHVPERQFFPCGAM